MALPAVDTEERLLRLIAAAEPRLRDALLAAVTASAASIGLDEIEQLITQGRLDEAIEVAVRAGSIRLADEATAVFVLAGQDTAEFLSDVLEVTVGFDQTNFRAVRIMQEERLRLIREFDAGQREATREAMVEGITRGENPVAQARRFRGSIGLTGTQQRAVDNYRRLLETGSSDALRRQLRDRRFDRTVARAVRGGPPLTAQQIDRMVDRYRERSLRFRSETIARTEALRAVHQASQESYQQAIDDGQLDPGQLVQQWITARDERVRGSHRTMHNQKQAFGDVFISGRGARLRHPGDPSALARETVRCRCALTTRIV